MLGAVQAMPLTLVSGKYECDKPSLSLHSGEEVGEAGEKGGSHWHCKRGSRIGQQSPDIKSDRLFEACPKQSEMA